MQIGSKNHMFYKGFTLIELLIVIAIAGIVISIGIPNFTATIQNHRLTTNANGLFAALQYARSEAIRRTVRVHVERNGGSSTNWDGGWNIFIDSDSDDSYTAGTDTLLKTYPAMTNGFTLRTGANYGDWVSFEPTGLLLSSGALINDSFRVCATAGDTVNSRKISINRTGRARVSSGDVLSCP